MRRALITSALAALAVSLAIGVSASSSATPPPSAKVAPDVIAARAATAKYVTDLSRAKAAGYGIITPMMAGMGFHFMNPKVTTFDVRKPMILVYERRAGKWQLGALEWVFTSKPAKPPLPGASYGSFPAACHYLDGTFVEASDQSQCAAKSPKTGSAFNFWHPTLVTLHMWAWYPNPAGLFNSTNPLLKPFGGE